MKIRQGMRAGLVAALCAGLGSCEVTETPVGSPVIRAPSPATEFVGLEEIRSGPDMVGRLRTYRFHDGSGREVRRVYDHLDRPAGFVTPDGQAFRIRAHGDHDLVSSDGPLETSLAAILGRRGESVALHPLQSTEVAEPEITPDPGSEGAPPRR